MPNMIAAGTLGLYGFCLLDLRTRVYQPIKKPKKADEDDVVAGKSATELKRFRVVYPSVKQAMSVNWAALGARVPSFFGALQLLCSLQAAARRSLLSPRTRFQ